jgi:DNA mismatch repair protein MutS
MIYDDYVAYLEQYRAKFGDGVLILMEVGSFYELYNCDKNLGADVKAISELLNMQASKKDKKLPLSRNNPQMAGFPSHSLRRHLPTLVDAGYTIVLVSQVGTVGGSIQRKVTEVVSRATYVDGCSHDDSATVHNRHLMAIYGEEGTDPRSKQKVLVLGAAFIDLTTGHIATFASTESSATGEQPLDELYSITCSYNPIEVVVLSEIGNAWASSLPSHLDITGRARTHVLQGRDDLSECTSVRFQNTLFGDLFFPNGLENMLTPLEVLDLDRQPGAATALCAGLRFARDHSDSIVRKLRSPLTHINHNGDKVLSLCYNTAKQLNITATDPTTPSLTRILNRCVTAMGKRAMLTALLNPIADKEELNKRYDMIDALVSAPHQVKAVREKLRRVYDIERLFRRIHTGKITPAELTQIMSSLEALENLGCVSDVCSTVTQVLRSLVDMDEAAKWSSVSDTVAVGSECKLFITGAYPEVDAILQAMQSTEADAKGFVDSMIQAAGGAHGFFKLECTDRDGWIIITTQKRWKDVSSTVQQVLGSITTTFTSASGSCRLTHPLLQQAWSKQTSLQTELKHALLFAWFDMLDRLSLLLSSEQRDSQIVCAAAELDVIATNAHNALEFCYTRPVIRSGDSCVRAKGLRHAIIERIHTSIPYIENDVELGYPGGQRGFLLYGLNAAGKSSLMKALGIATVMAQAGMYVPCRTMEFAPYKRLFTRITSGDNIQKGQSTFMVEMSELRTILKKADKFSLVVGDELCAGTESVSGTAIVAAGVLKLLECGSSFILTTHLHDLVGLRRIKEAGNGLGVYHLAVEYDAKNDLLVYDRRLQPGSGSSVYGLEVCRALDMDPSFLALANTIRQEYCAVGNNAVAQLGDAVPPVGKGRRSRYNARVDVRRCSLCGVAASEVHHIRHQAEADEHGVIDGVFKKNAEHNLVALCEGCHDKIHVGGELTLVGYKQTSAGRRLVVV